MKQQNLDLELWKNKLTQFAKEREWEVFHTPKNLAMALSVECAELTELFQWMSEAQSKNIQDPELRTKISHECADVLVYLMRMTQVLEIDLVAALEEKFIHNAKKYPADKVRGSSKKYNQYD